MTDLPIESPFPGRITFAYPLSHISHRQPSSRAIATGQAEVDRIMFNIEDASDVGERFDPEAKK